MTDISAAIRKRISEIDAELAANPLHHEKATLERALADLNGGSGARTSKAKTKGTAGRRSRKSGKRAPRGERRRQVLEQLKKDPGLKPSEVARAIGASPNQVHGIIAKLRRDKLVRKQGKGYALTAAAAPTS